jgi:hypothetical protein
MIKCVSNAVKGFQIVAPESTKWFNLSSDLQDVSLTPSGQRKRKEFTNSRNKRAINPEVVFMCLFPCVTVVRLLRTRTLMFFLADEVETCEKRVLHSRILGLLQSLYGIACFLKQFRNRNRTKFFFWNSLRCVYVLYCAVVVMCPEPWEIRPWRRQSVRKSSRHMRWVRFWAGDAFSETMDTKCSAKVFDPRHFFRTIFERDQSSVSFHHEFLRSSMRVQPLARALHQAFSSMHLFNLKC